MNSTKKFISGALAIVAGAGTLARADILWDQSNLVPYTTPPTMWPDLETKVSTGGGGYNFEATWVVDDVVVPTGGWRVERVTTFFSAAPFQAMDPSNVVRARLNIWPKTGSLPVEADEPPSSPIVAAHLEFFTYGTSALPAWKLVTNPGLSVVLDPGEYWIGLTPIVHSLIPLAERNWHLRHGGSITGQPAAQRSLSGAVSSLPQFPWERWNDPIIIIRGEEDAFVVHGEAIPAPGSLMTLLLLVPLGARRRR